MDGEHRESGGVSRGGAKAGFTLVEAVIAVVVLALLALAVGASMTSSLSSSHRSSEMSRAARFLEETMAGVQLQNYDAVLVMNGNTFYDRPAAAQARFRVELAVTPESIGLLRIRARLVDQGNDKELTRLVTYRSRR